MLVFFLYSVKKCYKKKRGKAGNKRGKKGGEGEKNLQTTKIKKSKKRRRQHIFIFSKSTPPTHTHTHSLLTQLFPSHKKTHITKGREK